MLDIESVFQIINILVWIVIIYSVIKLLKKIKNKDANILRIEKDIEELKNKK